MKTLFGLIATVALIWIVASTAGRWVGNYIDEGREFVDHSTLAN